MNVCDLDFDLSRSLKVKCRDVIGLPICGFLLMVNTNIGPNSARLRDIGLSNISDLELDLEGHSRSNVKVPLDYYCMISY